MITIYGTNGTHKKVNDSQSESKTVTIYGTNGTHKKVKTLVKVLKESQEAVGGYIEKALSLSDGRTLYCDDEGLLKGKPMNPFFPHFAGDLIALSEDEENVSD